MDDLRARKAALRKAVLARRDALPAAQHTDLNQRITQRLLALPALAAARAVLAYASFGSEFDTSSMVDAVLGAGKRLALPRVDRRARRIELFFVASLRHDLVAGIWGIREPAPERCQPATLDEIGLVLAPGVAFSPRCERLGYGGGFYDRLLSGRPVSGRPGGLVVAAAAFDLQVVPDLPVGPADVPVDLVVTESAIYHRPATDGD